MEDLIKILDDIYLLMYKGITNQVVVCLKGELPLKKN
jgi:hypothetical protein